MEQDVAAIGERGQVVIPKEIRMKLGLKPKTKLLVSRRGNSVIMKKINLEKERKEIEAIFRRIDKKIEKYGEMTEEEIDQIIHKYRAKMAHKGR